MQDNRFTYDAREAISEDEPPTCILRLKPNLHDNEAFLATCSAFHQACAYVHERGKKEGTTGNARLHELCYREIRDRWTLNANLSVRALARASRQLKTVGEPPFEGHVVDYDTRILSLFPADQTVSIATVHGRRQNIMAEIIQGAWSSTFVKARLFQSGSEFGLLIWSCMPATHETAQRIA